MPGLGTALQVFTRTNSSGTDEVWFGIAPKSLLPRLTRLMLNGKPS